MRLLTEVQHVNEKQTKKVLYNKPTWLHCRAKCKKLKPMEIIYNKGETSISESLDRQFCKLEQAVQCMGPEYTFQDVCVTWPMQLCWSSPTAVEICTIATPNSTTKNPQLRNFNKKPHHKTVRHFFLASTQPNSVFNLITIQLDGIWQKKFQMEDDKKNQNGRRPKQFRNIQNCLGPLHAPFGVSFIFSSCTLWKTTSTENDLDGGRQHWRWGFVSSLARFFL